MGPRISKASFKTQVAVVLPLMNHFANFFAVIQLFHLVALSKLFTHSLIFVHKLRAKEKAIH